MNDIFRAHAGKEPEVYDVENSGTCIAVAEEFRIYKRITNVSDTAVYLALNDTAVNSAVPEAGIYLAPLGGSYEITLLNMYRGKIWAVTPAGTAAAKRVAVQSG